MLLRFRGHEGMFRLELNKTDTLNAAIEQLLLKLRKHGDIILKSSPNGTGEPKSDKWDQTLEELKLQNGDLLFYEFSKVNLNDLLDSKLDLKDGRIHQRQTQLCTHGPKGMCEYCQPLEPWDSDHQTSMGIKHLSVHAYRKKVQEEGGVLEMPNYLVNKNCRNGHLPYPQGFCSRCQPPAITLQQQRFRMVDHVEFVNSKIMENFIEFWRQTSTQRIGFLIGRYEEYNEVPLGIKLTVHAIYEPEQQNDLDALMLGELPTKNAIEAAEMLNLQICGVIFTDLLDAGQGKVVCKRHLNSYFLSSLEVVFASKLQNEFRHKMFNTEFSSRFVTCCVTGNSEGNIDVNCYQTSMQSEALVNADLIVPSTNPTVMRVNESTNSRYVPDIFFKHINEYKLQVLENARPAFPVDYLLVSLSHGFKSTPSTNFTIENRNSLKKQTVSQLLDFIEQNEDLKNFHFVFYLLNLQLLQSDLNLFRAMLQGNATREQFLQSECLNVIRSLAM